MLFNNKEIRFTLIGTNIELTFWVNIYNKHKGPMDYFYTARSAEGLCQHAAFKGGKTPTGPIRAKQVNRSSSVNGWQNRGQAGTSECTVIQCSCIHSSAVPECTQTGLQYKCIAV